MPDIFLSYAREDRERAKQLADALDGTRWSLFWDRTIPFGLTWRTYIGEALKEARCLVVAWSAASVDSEWVLEEADLGKRKGILIPVFFETVDPPLGFGAFQAMDLSDWDGRPDASQIQELVKGMERLLGPPASREDRAQRKAVDKKWERAEVTASDAARRTGSTSIGPVRRLATLPRTHPLAALFLVVAVLSGVGWVVRRVLPSAPIAADTTGVERLDNESSAEAAAKDQTIDISDFDFSSEPDIQRAVQQIMKTTGLESNFEIRRTTAVPNTVAVIQGNERLLLYNSQWLANMASEVSDWAPIAVLAHEIAHHLNGHTFGSAGPSPQFELEADRFAGFVLYVLGAPLEDAQAAVSLSSLSGSRTHPTRSARLGAVATGWIAAQESRPR